MFMIDCHVVIHEYACDLCLDDGGKDYQDVVYKGVSAYHSYAWVSTYIEPLSPEEGIIIIISIQGISQICSMITFPFLLQLMVTFWLLNMIYHVSSFVSSLRFHLLHISQLSMVTPPLPLAPSVGCPQSLTPSIATCSVSWLSTVAHSIHCHLLRQSVVRSHSLHHHPFTATCSISHLYIKVDHIITMTLLLLL